MGLKIKKMLVESTVNFLNKKIKLKTNDMVLFNNLRDEYKEYFGFENIISNENDIIKLKILNSEDIYDRYFDKVRKNRNKIDKVYIDIRRENIVIVDKPNNEIFIIYKMYDDEKLQYIEEVVCSIFGKMLENEGFLFIRAICASRGNIGALIICNKDFDETGLLLKLLESKFSILSKVQVGFKEDVGIAMPIRIGLSERGVENAKIDTKYIMKIKETQSFKKYQKEKEINNINDEKFNIKIREINKIFNVESIKKTKVKLILNLHETNINKIQITKMRKEELTELLISKKINGIYKPLIYLEKLFNKKQNNYLSKIIQKSYVDAYKIFINKESWEEIINYITQKIEGK